MKSSKILRKAARMVDRGYDEGGCCAIIDSAPIRTDADYERAMKRFEMVKPRRTNTNLYWWDIHSKEGNDARIIGLCLAAAIAESEGD